MSGSGEEPLVGVGVPTYGRPALLRKTLESILAQTHRNLDVVVSDNASPGTEVEEVVRAFARSDPRVRFFRQPENRGAAENFRFVFEEARGGLFVWAADDDRWDPRHVEGLVAAHQSGRFVLTASNPRMLDPAGRRLPFKRLPPHVFGRTAWSSFARFLLLHHWSSAKANLFHGLFRRDALAGRLAFDTTSTAVGVDHLVLLDVMTTGPVRVVPEVTWERNMKTPRDEMPRRWVHFRRKRIWRYWKARRRAERPPHHAEIDRYTARVGEIVRARWQGPCGWPLHAINWLNHWRIVSLF